MRSFLCTALHGSFVAPRPRVQLTPGVLHRGNEERAVEYRRYIATVHGGRGDKAMPGGTHVPAARSARTTLAHPRVFVVGPLSRTRRTRDRPSCPTNDGIVCVGACHRATRAVSAQGLPTCPANTWFSDTEKRSDGSPCQSTSLVIYLLLPVRVYTSEALCA
jgi:hypothetical protein